MIALPALSGLYISYAPYVAIENSGSGRLAAGTGALGLEWISFDLFLLHHTPDGQLTRHIRIGSFAGSPRGWQPAWQVPFTDPFVPDLRFHRDQCRAGPWQVTLGEIQPGLLPGTSRFDSSECDPVLSARTDWP
jgi:hypothetical protein